MEARRYSLHQAATPRRRPGSGGTDRWQPTWPLAAGSEPRAPHCPADRRIQITRPAVRHDPETRLIYRTAVYGPVCTVVWEGRSREAPPYPDHCGFAIDHRRFGILDHPLEPVIGRRDAPTRWRMMTARNIAAKHSRGGEPSISSAICYSAAAPDPGYGPATSAAQGCAPAGRFVVTFQSDLGSPVLFGKIFLFSYPPNHIYNVSHPVPHRGAFRDRHGRRAWDAVDAAAFCARWDRRAGSLNP